MTSFAKSSWKPGLLALLLCLGSAAGARADLILSGRSNVASMGMPVVSQEMILIKGPRLRRDVIDRGRSYSYLYDPVAKKVAVIDHAMRQAEVHGMTSLAGDTEAKVNSQDVKMTATPTGRVQALKAWKCSEHSLVLSMPARLGNEAATLNLTGQVWLARNASEQAEVRPLLKAAESPDFFIGVPAYAKVAPAQAAAIGEAFTRLGAMGMPCAADIEARYEGNGPLVQMAKRVGSRFGIAFDQYKTEAVGDDRFVVPADYRVIQR